MTFDVEALVAAANAQKVAPPKIEFLGEYRAEFAATTAENLRHLATDSDGRKYRLVKMIFEEVDCGGD